MHRARDRGVEAPAREGRVGVGLGARVRDDHVVELETLRQAQRHDDHARRRELAVAVDDLGGIAQLLGEPTHGTVVRGDDGGEALVLTRAGNDLPQGGEELVAPGQGLDARGHAGAVDARELDGGVVLDKAAEQRRDPRGSSGSS